MIDLREYQRTRCIELASRGPGVHAYALDQAARLESRDPELHAGIVSEVEREIGKDLPAAKAALAWFERNPA